LEIEEVLQRLRIENEELRDAIKQLEQAQTPSMEISLRSNFKEPKLSLSEKFNGDCTRFRGFFNQVRLFILMQPLRYPTPSSQVGLVGTLLNRKALAWFSLLLENYSPLLNDFEGFMEEFTVFFGEVDKRKIVDSKIRNLC
jgi:hypothetical protein